MLATIEEEGTHNGRARFAYLMYRYQGLRGDADATLFWIEQHRQRFLAEEKGDKAGERVNRLLYAEALTWAGLYEEAVDALQRLCATRGPFTCLYIDNEPEYDPLRALPSYQAMRQQYLAAP